MNNVRRKKIDALIEQFESLKEEVDAIMEDEQGAFDGLPEALQEAERGQIMQEAISDLENASSSIEAATGFLELAKGI